MRSDLRPDWYTVHIADVMNKLKRLVT